MLGVRTFVLLFKPYLELRKVLYKKNFSAKISYWFRSNGTSIPNRWLLLGEVNFIKEIFLIDTVSLTFENFLIKSTIAIAFVVFS